MSHLVSTDAALLDALDAAVLDALVLPDPVDVGGGVHGEPTEARRYALLVKHPGRDEWAYPLDETNGPIVEGLRADPRFAALGPAVELDESWSPPRTFSFG